MPKERPARNAFDALVLLAVLAASVWVVPNGLFNRPARPRANAATTATTSTTTATTPPPSPATSGPAVTPVSTPRSPNRAYGPVVATIDSGGFTVGIAFGAASLWIASTGQVTRVDGASSRVRATIPVEPNGSGPAGIAFGAGSVWVPVSMPAALWRIDPASNRVVARIPLGLDLDGTVSVSATDGAVWIGSEDTTTGAGPAGWLTRVDPAHNRVASRTHLAIVPTSVLATPRVVWVAARADKVQVFDPKRGQVSKTLTVGGSLGISGTIALGAGALWIADPVAQQVLRVDPATMNVVARIPSGPVTGVAADATTVWAVSPDGILRIDPHRNKVTGTVPAADSGGVLAITTGAGAVWASRPDSVARIDPKRIRP